MLQHEVALLRGHPLKGGREAHAILALTSLLSPFPSFGNPTPLSKAFILESELTTGTEEEGR